MGDVSDDQKRNSYGQNGRAAMILEEYLKELSEEKTELEGNN